METVLVGHILSQGDKVASELTIQNLTDSAVASSRIGAKFPDPNAVRQANSGRFPTRHPERARHRGSCRRRRPAARRTPHGRTAPPVASLAVPEHRPQADDGR